MGAPTNDRLEMVRVMLETAPDTAVSSLDMALRADASAALATVAGGRLWRGARVGPAACVFARGRPGPRCPPPGRPVSNRLSPPPAPCRVWGGGWEGGRGGRLCGLFQGKANTLVPISPV